jgi:inorganic pyrophosphatase
MKFPSTFYRWRPHPWHGLEVGPNPPRIVHAYIEITPFDLVKYEVDKATGYIKVDRPQKTSSQPPTLYGFIPRTYCGTKVGKLSPKAKHGDGDPLDICVLSERPISRTEVILSSRVVGGLQVVDGGEADDKIIAVLENDNFWGTVEDINGLPDILVDRLWHYFETYKMEGRQKADLYIEKVYDCSHALKVVKASMDDYELEYGS